MGLFSKPDAEYLVVCLGNPGDEYRDTRHNAGFMCADILGERLGARYWKSQDSALTAQVSHRGHELVLAKPLTFMNLSGSAVRPLARRYSVDPGHIIVVHDEMDLVPGDVRVRRGGSASGHNGLKSIYERLGSKDMLRVRIGIGTPPGRMPGADYVLQRLKGEVLEAQRADCEVAVDAVLCLVTEGLEETMQRFNGRHRLLER
ncbi:MAG: aminoacyl-tRNA hydrolase [Actinomycetota bacterium]|nr:aminoacyl-tRNA hydrolase [Actinomycetota bacterium]